MSFLYHSSPLNCQLSHDCKMTNSIIIWNLICEAWITVILSPSVFTWWQLSPVQVLVFTCHAVQSMGTALPFRSTSVMLDIWPINHLLFFTHFYSSLQMNATVGILMISVITQDTMILTVALHALLQLMRHVEGYTLWLYTQVRDKFYLKSDKFYLKFIPELWIYGEFL